MLKVEFTKVEFYEFHDAADGQTYVWNATEGRKLAEARGAEIVSVHLAEAGITAGTLRDFAPDLDERKVRMMTAQALLVPLLWVPHKGKHVMIDGWHRVGYAVKHGFPCLPAYILTPDEAASIRIDGRTEGTPKP